MFSSISVHCFFIPCLLKNEERIQGEVRQTPRLLLCSHCAFYLYHLQVISCWNGSIHQIVSCEVCHYKCSPLRAHNQFHFASLHLHHRLMFCFSRHNQDSWNSHRMIKNFTKKRCFVCCFYCPIAYIFCLSVGFLVIFWHFYSLLHLY